MEEYPESEVVEIVPPSREKSRRRILALAAVAGIILLITVAVVAVVAVGRPRDRGRVSVVPLRGEMVAVVIVLPRPTEVVEATLYLAGGEEEVESGVLLPGETDVVIFFVAGEKEPDRVEVTTPAGIQTIPIGGGE